MGFIDIKKNNTKEHHIYLSPTIQFDMNTKRIYGMISHQILRAGHENFDTTKIEGGFPSMRLDILKSNPGLY